MTKLLKYDITGYYFMALKLTMESEPYTEEELKHIVIEFLSGDEWSYNQLMHVFRSFEYKPVHEEILRQILPFVAENAIAQYAIGIAYYHGVGIGEDAAAAVVFFKKSAEANYRHSIHMLSHCYYSGLGIQQDYDTAFKLTLDCALVGDTCSEFNLGKMYYLGHGTTKNVIAAAVWLSKAIEKNFESAIKFVAECDDVILGEIIKILYPE